MRVGVVLIAVMVILVMRFFWREFFEPSLKITVDNEVTPENGVLTVSLYT